MLRSPREAALEPRRVVVELRADEYAAIDKAIGPFVGVANYLKVLALAEARRRSALNR